VLLIVTTTMTAHTTKPLVHPVHITLHQGWAN